MKRVLMPRVLIPIVLAAASLAAPAGAQQGNVPNALQGFAKNRDQPVRVEAASLEVRDRDRTAVFTGNVVVQQGDTTMRSKQLVIHYNLDADKGQDKGQAKGQAAKGQADKSQAAKTATEGVAPRQIERLEASGGVIVNTREQTATGDNGLFEMKKNTVTLSGNVVLMQGPNVLRGERLVVDLNSGVSRIEAGKGGSGRVQGLFVPGSEKSDKGDAKAESKGDSKTDPKPPRAPVSPMPLRGN
ncbi:LptA/OstA family protein [Blastochloris viridis]|uniref:Lipopolysaccharide transport periplasmic proteinLptA n=1 Tax=Blastochloris viridis TaxID=1079 RepID=A0A0H5B8B1_BLAVI|nr:LptA/OstA family protein [Blastochloris viridis]ALK08316.1 LPS-assembly protein LptD [Blastochloris viridis]BAR98415.1 OstA-like protein [Blastochloris viridis]CUU44238.1 lipopolysaccharide transport periplasmic proteinLptA [Blastochloris viridis]